MIRVARQGAWSRLQPGELWASDPAGETYRDAPSSDLASLAGEIRAGRPWREAVAARYADANPWLHRIVTDPCRDLFLRMHPPPPRSLVLDVGAGWGQWTLPLAAAGHRVAALEPSPERLGFLRAAAAQEGLSGQCVFLQSDLLSAGLEPVFDLVCCIGVLEWVPRFTPGDPVLVQREFLRRLASCLAPGGRLVLGIENRLGLKYLLGARDDHTGLRGVSVLEAPLAAERHLAATGSPLRCLTYSLDEYKRLFAGAGLGLVRAHAAWPDYKLPARILPVDASLDGALLGAPPVAEHDGYDGSVFPRDFQEELASHYRSLAALGVAGPFAPSFYLEARA